MWICKKYLPRTSTGKEKKWGEYRAESAACTKITNSQVLKVLMEQENFGYQIFAARKLAEAKMIIEAKLREKFPKCEKIDFINIPEIYFAYDSRFHTDRGTQFPLLSSLFPSQTNLLVVGDAAIIPKAHQRTFDHYVDSILNEHKIVHTFVDTYDQVHVSSGNLHCATNEIRVCKPAKKMTLTQ